MERISTASWFKLRWVGRGYILGLVHSWVVYSILVKTKKELPSSIAPWGDGSKCAWWERMLPMDRVKKSTFDFFTFHAGRNSFRIISTHFWRLANDSTERSGPEKSNFERLQNKKRQDTFERWPSGYKMDTGLMLLPRRGIQVLWDTQQPGWLTLWMPKSLCLSSPLGSCVTGTHGWTQHCAFPLIANATFNLRKCNQSDKKPLLKQQNLRKSNTGSDQIPFAVEAGGICL